MTETETAFLYLQTIGWKTGNPHQIEIWFIEHDGQYYLCAERRNKSHWVQNIHHNPTTQVRVGSPASPAIETMGRVVTSTETELLEQLKTKMHTKYGWNEGLFVELKPKI